MRVSGFAVAVLTLVSSLILSACAAQTPVEEDTPEREFFVEPEERDSPEPRDPAPPASATATGSSIHQAPQESQAPEAPSLQPDPAPPPGDTIPIPDDPFYRPEGMDPCDTAHGFVDNDACLAQNGYPLD
ncbi:hypothetical protein [Nocardiopsis valliformis]|uniref:hypothetical protein n=1 Tax=Nocardiopsis valliformis TaxID=239974 RepID=UPI000346749F|nr:hypothetical protein [Nocardiopsis valliformis]